MEATAVRNEWPTSEQRDHWWRRPAAGGIIWVTWALVVRPEWTAVLLLLSPFALLSLGLRLASHPETGPRTPALETCGRLAPIVAVSAAISFVPDPGLVAATLSIPWLAFTSATALVGVGRLLSRRTLLDPGIGLDAGLVFVAVGGAWLTISRAGSNPLGFSDAIVQLTAVHFHYAGFALPIVAGVVASRLGRTAIVPAAVIIGVPLTALGITVGGGLEWVAATLMALAGMATAALLLRTALVERGAARWLTGTAGVALLAGMTLALGWSWSIHFGWRFLGLDEMAAFHGSLNALGFGLLGLIGLNLATLGESNDTVAPATEVGVHIGRPTTERLERLRNRARHQNTTNPIGLLDRPLPDGFRRKVWTRPVAHGDFAAASEAIRRWRGHSTAGIKRIPDQPAIALGETLAVAIPVGPIAVSATCRIVDIVDEPDRFGFTYATLPHHPEDGEESFVVTRQPDGSVEMVVTAVWRPATLANHVCPPLTAVLQNRAINLYLDGITTADASDPEAVR